jgi:AraC family transcriptional regulator of adaptative response / DNA-3-methyladenine glycosylase II
MNRAMVEVFRAPPSELRAMRRRADRLASDRGLVLRLPYRAPLDWPTLLAFFAPRAIAGVEHVEDGMYRRTLVVGGAEGAIEVTQGDGDNLSLRVDLPDVAGLNHVVQRVRRLFDLDCDPAAIAAVLPGVPEGLRLPGTWDGFEMGVRAILGQQVSVAGATTLAGRLVRQLGGDPFPAPETVAAADLDGIGLTGQRRETLRAFAAGVASGEIRLDRSATLDDVVRSLTAVRGIGPWTAQYMALRLGHTDAFPAGDLGLRKAAGLASDAELVELAEAWRPYRAYAAVHLWRGGARPARTSRRRAS